MSPSSNSFLNLSPFFRPAHILFEGCHHCRRAFFQRLFPYHIARVYCEAVCQTADIQFQAIVGIFGVVGFVQFGFAVLGPHRRQLGKIALAVYVDAATADVTLGVGIEAFEQHLDARVIQTVMVGVQEEVPGRDFESDPGCVL